MKDKKDQDGRQVFRSVGAVVVWWVWLLFAVGNLIDLAVQGRDHLSLVAAFILLFATGIVYITALRPRIIADNDGLTIANPVRDHRVGWAAVAGADPTDLLRVRCEWQEEAGKARRAFYSWAVHSSRRRQLAAEMRARRQARQGSRGGFGGMGGMGGFGLAASFGSSEPSPEIITLNPQSRANCDTRYTIAADGSATGSSTVVGQVCTNSRKSRSSPYSTYSRSP